MATMSQRSGGAFRSPAFTRFYFGQALSYAGDGLRTIAIPLLVFQLTGSAVSLGLTFALEITPFAIFSLVGGSFADRLERRRLMLVCDGVRFAIMALFAAAFATHRLTLPLLYTGVVLLAICGAIFLGCQSPSIPYSAGKGRSEVRRRRPVRHRAGREPHRAAGRRGALQSHGSAARASAQCADLPRPRKSRSPR